MPFNPLDGPATQFTISATTSSVSEVKDGSNDALKGRQVVTIMPLDGKIWVYFGNGNTTPSAADVKNKGFPHFKNSMRSYEAAHLQPLYIVSDTGTVDVRISERS